MDRKQFFNSLAETWEARCRHDSDRIGEILDLVPIHEGDTVLDVGTGTGILIPFLLDRIGGTGRITAIDMAENLIRIARAKCGDKRVRYLTGDFLHVDFPPSTFDVIVCYVIVCYSVFPHFKDQRLAVQRMGEAVRPGGVMAVCHSQGREHLNQLHAGLDSAVAWDHLPEARVVAEYLLAAGCEILSVIDTERLFVVVGRKWRGAVTSPR